jgi:hypothetical protein
MTSNLKYLPQYKTKINAYILVHLLNWSKYLLHQRWAWICFMFERPEGRGTSIFRIKVRAKLSSLLHGVRCTALPSFHAMYSLHSPVGLSHGNSETKYKIYITLISLHFIHFLRPFTTQPWMPLLTNCQVWVSIKWCDSLVFKPWKEETLLFGCAHTMRACTTLTVLLENFHPRSFVKVILRYSIQSTRTVCLLVISMDNINIDYMHSHKLHNIRPSHSLLRRNNNRSV